MTKFKQNDTVFYVTWDGTGEIIRANVVSTPDETGNGYLVEAQFYVRDGKDEGPYQGARYPIAEDRLFINALDADNARTVARNAARTVA